MYLKGITEVSPRYFRPLYTLGLKVGARLRGIQPCYFWALYTLALLVKRWPFGIQPCYFWALYACLLKRQIIWYTPLSFQGLIHPTQAYSVLSCWHHLSHENQLTEHSCFHDDHASPQALIPVIPSVLAFRYLAKSGAAAGVGPAPLCVCCQGQLRCGPHSRWRQNRHRKCRWFHRAHQTFPTHVQ